MASYPKIQNRKRAEDLPIRFGDFCHLVSYYPNLKQKEIGFFSSRFARVRVCF